MDHDSSSDEKKREAREFLEALDESLEKGPWDTTLFLRAVGKKLRDARTKLAIALGVAIPEESPQEIASKQTTQAALAAQMAQQRGEQKEIFILMYCADGGSLTRWEKLLLSLEKQVVSRPIYANESDVRETIRAKKLADNEAYVSAYINKSDLLPVPADKIPRDRQGHPLLILKDGRFNNRLIHRFYHKSGVYAYRDNKLYRQGDVNFSE